MRLFLFAVEPINEIIPALAVILVRGKEAEQENEDSPAGANANESKHHIDKLNYREYDVTHISSAFLFFPVEKRDGNRKRRSRTTAQMVKDTVRTVTRIKTRTAAA